jgi:hypothetical protein
MKRFVLVTALLLVACGTDGEPDQGAATSPSPADEGTAPGDPDGAEAALTGTFGGDPGLEGGCDWLDAEDGRFEIIWPDGYAVHHEPLRLEGPGGDTIASEGDEVAVDGAVDDDMVSVCQVGRIFRATRVLAVGDG